MPFIMLTVRDAGEDKIQALDAGACDYVTKPFAMGELLARIWAVLRRTLNLEISGVIHPKLEDIEISFESRRVIVGCKPVRMTSNEFDLLPHLANTQQQNDSPTGIAAHGLVLRECGPARIPASFR
jgi:DNA-binding response OmpR family regulator